MKHNPIHDNIKKLSNYEKIKLLLISIVKSYIYIEKTVCFIEYVYTYI